MADNPKATLGAVTAGRLSLNEIFPTAAGSKTGLVKAWAGTPEGQGQENLGPQFTIPCQWDFALEADRKAIAKMEPSNCPQDEGAGSASLAQLFGSFQNIPILICQVNHSCVNPTENGK